MVNRTKPLVHTGRLFKPDGQSNPVAYAGASTNDILQSTTLEGSALSWGALIGQNVSGQKVLYPYGGVGITPFFYKRNPPLLRSSTGWFEVNTPNCARHECRMEQILECHIFWYHTDRREQWKRVICPLFFVSGPRADAAVAKTCPHPTTVLQKGQQWSGVSVARNLFLMRPVPGTPRHADQTFRASIRRPDCVSLILSHISRPKLILC